MLPDPGLCHNYICHYYICCRTRARAGLASPCAMVRCLGVQHTHICARAYACSHGCGRGCSTPHKSTTSVGMCACQCAEEPKCVHARKMLEDVCAHVRAHISTHAFTDERRLVSNICCCFSFRILVMAYSSWHISYDILVMAY